MTRSMIAAADPSNGVRITTLRIILALVAVVLAAGCADVPADRLGPPSTALPATGYTALGRIAAAAAPDAELSGFRLMPGGGNALDTRLQLARRAERSLDVQYYQIENDGTGRYFLRTLRDAAQRGVRVRLLVDDLYTAGDDELLLAFAAHDNVEMPLFNPFAVGRALLSTRLLGALLDFDRVKQSKDAVKVLTVPAAEAQLLRPPVSEPGHGVSPDPAGVRPLRSARLTQPCSRTS